MLDDTIERLEGVLDDEVLDELYEVLMLQYEADELLVDVIDEILVFEILLLNDDEVEQATFDATDEADDEALLIRLDETLL